MIQIDIDMPKNCQECRLVYRHIYDDHRYLCCLIPPYEDGDINCYTNKRHPKCPLKEVK